MKACENAGAWIYIYIVIDLDGLVAEPKQPLASIEEVPCMVKGMEANYVCTQHPLQEQLTMR